MVNGYRKKNIKHIKNNENVDNKQFKQELVNSINLRTRYLLMMTNLVYHQHNHFRHPQVNMH